MYWITDKLSTEKFPGFSVIDPNDNLVTDRLIPREDALAIMEELNNKLLLKLFL